MSLCINPTCINPQNLDDMLFCQCCGSELLLMGRYRVHNLMSDKGGFGNTYQVIHKNTAKVLKVLTNNHPHAVELFQQESRILSTLNHPGIPQGEEDFLYFPRNSQTPLYCLVMEKIEGMDLEEYQKQRQNRPIDQRLALEWLKQLTEILHAVHQENFFHRDIKPSNIILKPDGQLTLIDFGAVRQVTATILAGGQNTGIYTPGYAPPEQEKGYAVPQSDFFALGRTFVYLLTGKYPNDPEIYDQYNNDLLWRIHANNIAPQLADFIDQLMADKASQRPGNTDIILKKLTEFEQPLKSIKTNNNHQEIQPSVIPPTKLTTYKYAGFWRRFFAYIIDILILTIIVSLIAECFDIILFRNFSDMLQQWLVGVFWTIIGISNEIFHLLMITSLVIELTHYGHFSSDIDIATLISITIALIMKWLYFTILESSSKQSTWGKRILGLSVITLNGDRVSFWQANVRFWSKTLSTLILYIGFMMTGWTNQKQALHDKIAQTIVIKK